MFFKKRIKVPDDLLKELQSFNEKNTIKYSNRIDLDDDGIRYMKKQSNNNIEKNATYSDKESFNLIVEEPSEDYVISKIKEISLTETFQELLFKYIDKSGFSDLEIYKKAHIDRRLFSKIKSDVNYHPSFGTVTLLALSLTLNIEDYELLLKSASYSLSTSDIQNVVLRYCFEHKIYDIFYVNNLLYTITDKEIKDL